MITILVLPSSAAHRNDRKRAVMIITYGQKDQRVLLFYAAVTVEMNV